MRALWLALAILGLAALAAVLALPAFSAPPAMSPSPQSAANDPPRSTMQLPTLTVGTSPASGSGPTPGPRSHTASASATATPSASVITSPVPAASPTRHPDSADEFELENQVVEIGFPLMPSTRYRYRDNWGDLRHGAAEHYNHAHSLKRGELRRAHDGIDLYARPGEPVLAPFAGIVVEPADLWQPWHPERYGNTAVIVSREARSEGYLALLSHLERLWVQPGDVLRRGEVIGTVGSTGNAEGGRAHVHFELRAPFPLAWDEVGEQRLVDAFNPYPSLVAADPRLRD